MYYIDFPAVGDKNQEIFVASKFYSKGLTQQGWAAPNLHIPKAFRQVLELLLGDNL